MIRPPNISDFDWRNRVNKLFNSIYTISYLYYEQLKDTHYNLKENYNSLKLSIKNIKASLFNCLYISYYQNFPSDDQLLNIINTEFSKANIVFIFTDNTNFIPIDMKCGIIYAETAKNQLEIYINENFIKFLRKGFTNQEYLDELAKSIFNEYTHEYTHLYQINQEKIPQKSIEINDIKTSNDIKIYLSHQREIDAHAREAAAELAQYYNSLGNILNMLKQISGALCKSKAYEKYYATFGKVYKYTPETIKLMKNLDPNAEKEIIRDKKIFNQFRKRIYDFLLLDKKFLFDKNNNDLNPLS